MTDVPDKTPPITKTLTPAAKRALAEAAARRKAQAAKEASRPAEKAGPKGAEPTRYGDWASTTRRCGTSSWQAR